MRIHGATLQNKKKLSQNKIICYPTTNLEYPADISIIGVALNIIVYFHLLFQKIYHSHEEYTDFKVWYEHST